MDTTETGRRWAMLALLFAARIGMGFQFQTLGSVADPLASDLSLNFAEIGSLIGLFMMPGLVLSLPAGLAGRYASDRVLVALGLAALALGGALAAVAGGFAALAVGRLLCGAGFVLTALYFTKMVADWFTGRELATAMAILLTTWPLGIAMGQVGHGWLATAHGWRAPFVVASFYCLVMAAAVLVAYRPPRTGGSASLAQATNLSRREWKLTLIASMAWASVNAAYIIYLSFAPRVLAAGGLGSFEAASIVSLASWVMLLSGTMCGYIVDRTGRADLILYVCLCFAIVSLALMPHVAWAVPLSLAFGLIGMSPAGPIMALTGEAMAPDKRAFGMGVFYSAYFLLVAPAPAVAGWLYDWSGDVFIPILFAIAMFILTFAANITFRVVQRVKP
jgi:predicted MFS family arabinose efflux permease